MSDIVARLKQRINELRSSQTCQQEEDSKLMLTAATEIERLQAVLDQYQAEREKARRGIASSSEQSSSLHLWFP